MRVFKRTHDDWHPSYRLSNWYNGTEPEKTFLCEVSLLTLTGGEHRVCVWGNDDFGLERDFPSDQKDEAFKLFISTISQETVSIGWLRRFGFVNA
jgi:hypothetical protein